MVEMKVQVNYGWTNESCGYDDSKLSYHRAIIFITIALFKYQQH